MASRFGNQLDIGAGASTMDYYQTKTSGAKYLQKASARSLQPTILVIQLTSLFVCSSGFDVTRFPRLGKC